MYFAGIDAHLKYVQVAVLDRIGKLTLETRVLTREPHRLLEALAPFRPLEVVVETCPFWPWIHDLVVPEGIRFHLAHATRLRAIAAAPQKNDAVDARLLARMLLSGLIPEAYPRPAHRREQLRLVRHRAALVRQRTASPAASIPSSTSKGSARRGRSCCAAPPETGCTIRPGPA